jgi:radical SAM protein with 4Fe4S-binding SPASM domain
VTETAGLTGGRWSSFRRIYRAAGGTVASRPNLLRAALFNLRPPQLRPAVVGHRPVSYSIYVNTMCNYRCPFCFLITDHHVGTPAMSITDAQFEAIVDHPANRSAARVTLGGGEPFLHPRLFHYVDALKARRKTVAIYTNGSLIDRHFDTVARSGIDDLNVSHYDDEFAKIDPVLRRLRAAAPQLRIRLSKILTATTFHRMEGMIELCLSAGIPVLMLQNFFPYENREPEAVIRADNGDFAAERRRLQIKYRAAPIRIVWPNLVNDAEPFNCQNIALNVTYDSRGSIAPCCFIVPPDRAFGNLFDESDAWNSAGMASLRSGWKSKQPPHAACQHCYFKHGLRNRYV